jgi:uncharacterized damage-inducible protein DinB
MSAATPELVRRGFAHAAAADEASLASLQRAGWPARASELMAHVLGAEEVWLARVEGRAPQAPVWPQPEPARLAQLARAVGAGWAHLVAELDDAGLARPVAYVNSAGRSFENALGDLLLHVLLHGQWHRAQVALLLRDAGHEPAPQDYVAWVRGAPAATRADRVQRPSA